MTVAELPACLRGRETVWRALDSSEDREELVRSTCRKEEVVEVMMMVRNMMVVGRVVVIVIL